MNTLPSMDPSLIMEIPQDLVRVDPRPIRKPRVWTSFAVWLSAIILGTIASVAAFILVGVVMGIVMGTQGLDAATIQTRVQDAVSQPLPALLLTLLPFQFGMMLVVLFAARRSPEPLQQRLGLLPSSGRASGRIRVATMAGFTLASALAAVIGSSLLLGDVSETSLAAAINNGSWGTITLLSIILSVVPALVEAILCRGYIQRRLLERWSAPMAIGTSTLLFAVIHADSLQHIIGVVPLGIVTGMLAFRTNSVRPAMLVHAIHNAAAVGFGALMAMLAPRLGDETLGFIVIGLIAMLGLIGLPAVVSLMKRVPSESIDREPGAPHPAVEMLAADAA